MKFHHASMAGLFVCFAAASAGAATYEQVKLELLPKWARDSLYNPVSLDIDQVVVLEKMTRFEAVEVQNQLRDAVDADPKANLSLAYASAVKNVRAGKVESGWKPVVFKTPQEFIVALDMDETLLMQWYASGYDGNADLTGLVQDTVPDQEKETKVGKVGPPFAKFAPGAEEFIKAMKANPNCRGVVVFSAKEDRAALDLVNKWKFAGGEPALKYLDGIFTRNHLIIGKKIWAPSKDLEMLDPSPDVADVKKEKALKHVLLIDDNPGRVFQPKNLRAQPKFDADQYLAASKSSAKKLVVEHFENAFTLARQEIEDSVVASKSLGIPFAQAYLPYSYWGTRILANFESVLQSRPAALRAVRLNPELQEAAFFPAKP